MIFPDPYICSRIFPDYLGLAMQDYYIKKGIRILKGDKPQSIDKNTDKFIVTTENNGNIEADIAIVGIGIKPDIQLAEKAGLKIDNGIVVNEYLQSSNPDIYAAGDNALFFHEGLGKAMRMEHWDNALSQGKQAGKNMTGALESFTYLPYFYSDLFDFGYEAIGEIDSSLETFADWQEKNRKGTIYYLKDNRVRGMMMCNVWDKIPMARKIVLEGKSVEKNNLRAQK
jgi:NADPH-dependent 2,4-dienoyl-CoA reductase/sulfur reductase-like enzyme